MKSVVTQNIKFVPTMNYIVYLALVNYRTKIKMPKIDMELQNMLTAH